MNVIDSYLDTLFAPYPDSPRLHEARSELRTMMEDQQDGLMAEGLTESQAVGRVIAEFGTLEEVAPVLGIDTELGRSPAAPTADRAPTLGISRAREYVAAVHRSQWLLAAGVSLFVLSALPLLLLIAATGGPDGRPAVWAIAVGITAVLVMIPIGLVLFIVRDARLKDFEDIDQQAVTPTAEVRRYAAEVRRENRRRSTVAHAVAIVLWILCALPTILLGLLGGEDNFIVLYGVCLTLAIVALGLAIMTRGGWSDSVAGTLLQEQDEEDDDPEYSTNPAVRAVAAVFWPVMAAIYLGWSFLSGDWGITWVLWPVAGLLYAGLAALSEALRRDDPSAPTGVRRA